MCRWSTARKKCPGAPNTRPTLSSLECWPGAFSEILDVDIAEAAKLPGVKAIVTGAECDKGFGVLPVARTEHVLARDRVRYRGEPIAAVAAVDDATAKEALRRIKLK